MIATLLLAACSEGDTPAPQAVQAPAAQTPAAAPVRTVTPPAPTETVAQSTESTAATAAPRAPAAVVERRFQEGRHYTRLSPQQPTVSTEGDRVEVVEVFQYSCPACFNFEPYLSQWEEGKAEYVNFVRVPAPWNALSELHARAYYTAETLGVLEQIHTPFFREIHVNGNYMQSEAELAEFFAGFGVDEETFTSTFSSFAVHTKLQRARDLVTRYRVSGTPGIVVDGKYVTGGQQAESYENWFEIIDELAAVEYAN